MNLRCADWAVIGCGLVGVLALGAGLMMMPPREEVALQVGIVGRRSLELFVEVWPSIFLNPSRNFFDPFGKRIFQLLPNNTVCWDWTQYSLEPHQRWKPGHKIVCDEAIMADGSFSDAVIVTENASELPPNPCETLEKALVTAHVDAALQNKLSPKSPYVKNLVYACHNACCRTMGLLGSLRYLPSAVRDKMANITKVICPKTWFEGRWNYKILVGDVQNASQVCEAVRFAKDTCPGVPKEWM